MKIVLIIHSALSEIRNDSVVKEKLAGNRDHLLFHQKCYDYYTHIKNLAKFDTSLKHKEEEHSTSKRRSSRKREGSGKFIL